MKPKPTDKPAALKDPLENFLGYQLRRAAFATLPPLIDALAQIGLRPVEAAIIRFVEANPGCTQAEIGRALGVQRTNMVPIVSALMARGLLKRTPADGRSHALYLTRQGDELHRSIAKVTLANEEQFFGDVPKKTRQTVMRLLRVLRAKCERV